MKNIKITVNILTLVLVLFVSGCKDYTEPKWQPEMPWLSVDQMEMGVVAPYVAMNGGSWNNVLAIYTAQELMTTDFGTTLGAPSNESPSWAGRLFRQVGIESLGWTRTAYTQIWGAIALANEALTFLNGSDPKNLFPNDAQSKLDEIPRQKAELYFMRGFAYHRAALFFTPPYDPKGANDDRVLALKESNDNPQNSYIGTTKELWDFIINDLKTAKSLMPKSFHILGRIDYYTICGELARAYFHTGDFTNAEAECTEIISSGKYSLSADVMEAWQVQSVSGVPATEPKEVMWMYSPNSRGQFTEIFTVFTRAFPYATAWGMGNLGAYGRGPSSEGMWVGTRMSDAMAKKLGWMTADYKETDLARTDKRYGNTWLRVEGYFGTEAALAAEVAKTGDESLWNKWSWQYPNGDHPFIYLDKYYRGESPSQTCYALMRYPEFLLMRAAIRFQTGNSAGAATDVNVIRERAGLPDIPAGSLTADAIDREYIIEMGGEGGYQPYLMALRRPIPPGDRQGVADVNPPYTGWYWKIPIQEVATNAGYNGIPDPNSK